MRPRSVCRFQANVPWNTEKQMSKHLKTLSLVTLSIMLVFSISSCSLANPGVVQQNVVTTGSITDKKISEASGLAVSQIEPDRFWVLNDSGNKPVLFAIDGTGKRIGKLKIKGVKNKDWEDLASFTYQGTPYLLIADVGDNRAKRKHYSLHLIEEPNPKQFAKDDSLSVKPEWTIKFEYEDGPRDCESVAVDVKQGKVLLLSKRNQPPVLYELPLTALFSKNKMTAQRIGLIQPLPDPELTDFRMLRFANHVKQPTAMDITADGSAAIVLTYAKAYLYRNDNGSGWAQVFARSPQEIDFPYLEQAESACFDASGQNVYITSEGLPAPLLRVDLKSWLQ